MVRRALAIGLTVIVAVPLLYGRAPAYGAGRVLQSFPLSAWGADERAFLKRKPAFLPAGWKARIVLAPPPDDERTRLELRELLKLVPRRGALEAEISRQVSGAEAEFLSVLPRLDQRSSRALQTLIAATANEAAIAGFYFKRKFARVRPWTLEPRLTTSVPRPPHPAYPSGHATQGMLVGLVLGEVIAACRERFEALGRRIGRNREIAGVHYKSDTDAGFSLAEQMFELMKRSKPFRSLLAKTKRVVATLRCA